MISNVGILIDDFIKVAELSKINLIKDEINNKQAVYVFTLATDSSKILKVGKAGPKSNARFNSQHYSPGRSMSNLAYSIIRAKEIWPSFGISTIDEKNVGKWIRQNTDRDHFFIPAEKGRFALSLLEAFLHCRLNPIFEGKG
jgi:hypothetical protein